MKGVSFFYRLDIEILMFARIVKEYELLVALKEINAHRDTMPFTEFIRHNIVDLGVILVPKY